MFIIEWWNSLGIASQIFACFAIPATLILLIQTILMFIGLGSESDVDGDGGFEDISDDVSDMTIDDVDGDVDIDGVEISKIEDASGLDGLRIFTVRGIIAFFVVFGWVGMVMDRAGAELWLTLPIATVSGFAMMVVLALLVRSLMKLRNNGNIDNKNALGVSGKVHLVIPPERSGEGKVHIMLQGSYVERNAVTDDEKPIPTGSEIVVVGISGHTHLVVRRK